VVRVWDRIWERVVMGRCNPRIRLEDPRGGVFLKQCSAAQG
jgi:hypothetical protein